MAFRRFGRVRGPATLMCVLGGLLAQGVPIAAAARSPLVQQLPAGARDITSSATGRQLAAAAESRFVKAGVAASALVVVKDSIGYTVAPVGTPFASSSVRLSDGTTGVELDPESPAAPTSQTTSLAVAPQGRSLAVSPALAGSWGNPVASACFSRITDTWTYMDHCYQMWKESNDNSSTRDFFALRHWGTAFPNSPWVLNSASVSSKPTSSSSAQSWSDYSPTSGQSGGSCKTVGVSIDNPVGGLSYSVQMCEEWEIAKGNPAVTFSQYWIGPGTRSSRAVEYMIAVNVVQGGWPQWSLPATTNGSAF